MIRIKRVYEPRVRGDGARILVERLWPRGMRKEALEADSWLKEVAPSTQLRQWFGHQVERWAEFRRRYHAELRTTADVWAPILEAAAKGPVTLLYSARDVDHNGALVLRDFLIKRQARCSGAPRPRKRGSHGR